jgi:hypothetical protein
VKKKKRKKKLERAGKFEEVNKEQKAMQKKE